MSEMTYYEIKKVFSKKSGRASLLVLAGCMLVILYFQLIDTAWVDEKGETITGVEAVRNLREAKKEWTGMLDSEKLAAVIAENSRINAAPEAASEEVSQNNIAYGWKQGFSDIRELLNRSYGEFQDYNYYTADSLTVDNIGDFYRNRTEKLRDWFAEEGGGQELFSDAEKAFLIEQYEDMQEPLYYDYQDGWKNLFQWAPGISMIITMVCGFLCAGIFADEFRLKASAVFYSSCHGRGKAVRAKLKAGILIAAGIYWTMMMVYSAVTLGIFGADGVGCMIQSTPAGWKSFYNITNGQEYLLILLGGYIGCLFMILLVMLVSAALKSSRLAVTVPFILIFLPSFLSGSHMSVIDRISGLLPDRILQINNVIRGFYVYKIGSGMLAAVPVLFAIYLILSVVLVPVIYRIYRTKQVQG